MDVVNSRCAGLDAHQATVAATVRVPAENGGRQVLTQTFGTMTADLLALRDWLQAYGVTHVALESTGVWYCGVRASHFVHHTSYCERSLRLDPVIHQP